MAVKTVCVFYTKADERVKKLVAPTGLADSWAGADKLKRLVICDRIGTTMEPQGQVSKTAAMARAVILMAVVLAGCATRPRVNERTLTQLYAKQRQAAPPEVTIFIPGIMGTVLKDRLSGQIVWGQMWSGALDMLALPIDAATGMVGQDHLVPIRLLDSFTWIGGLIEGDIYATTQRVAKSAGGFTQGDINNPQPGENAYSFKYDWRRDLIEAAQGLGGAIERIKKAQGRPDLKVRLLCHSAGGLVARYYVKYGTIDVLDQDPLPPPTYAGAANVSKVVMLGTPNAGSLEAFQHLHQGLAIPLVGKLTPKTLFTMPASYQLLPAGGASSFVDASGKPLVVDLYDPANWERYGWSVFAPQRLLKRYHQWLHRSFRHGQKDYDEEITSRRKFLAFALHRAERFHRALRAGDPKEEKQRVQYIVLGADCEPTQYRAVLERRRGVWRTRFRSWRPELRKALTAFGDGSVTKDSLLGFCYASDESALPDSRLPGARAVFFCESHFELPKNVTYLDNVLHTLLEE